MENLNLVKLFLESKDRFINKLSALSPEEKSKLIKFFRDHSNYENQIDWNNKNLTFADFEPLLNKQSKALLKKEYRSNPRLMFSDSKNFMIYKETVNRIMANISFKINDSLNNDVPINDTADTNNIQIGTTIFLFDTLDLVNVS